MISDYNQRITIRSFSVTQDANGDIVPVEDSEYTKWAKVRQSSGNLLISNGMMNFTEAFDIEMLYEVSRPTRANYQIEYKGKLMKIYNVRIEQEGRAWTEVVTAYTSN